MNRMSSTLWILTGALAALSINSAGCLGNVTGTEGLEEASDAQEGTGDGKADDPGQQANEAEDLPANDCGDPPIPCTTGVLGDGIACFDYGDIKQQTYDLCVAQGLTLTDLKIAGDCPDGSANLVEYTCCPIPEPTPTTCIGLLLGDGSTCQAPEDWKQQAFDACVAEGLSLTGLGLSSDNCPNGGSTYAKVECCGDANDPGDPPQPPDACIYDALGDGTCQSVEDWKVAAADYCAANALSLAEIYYSEECPGGESGYVKFACCEP